MQTIRRYLFNKKSGADKTAIPEDPSQNDQEDIHNMDDGQGEYDDEDMEVLYNGLSLLFQCPIHFSYLNFLSLPSSLSLLIVT